MCIFALSAMADLHWEKEIPAAFELAKKEQKIVMVFVEGKNCQWCKKMKHRTLSDEKVEKRLQSYILLEVMEEDDERMKTLPEVQGVPTIFFMDAKKNVIEEVVGYFDVVDFITYINSVENFLKK